MLNWFASSIAISVGLAAGVAGGLITGNLLGLSFIGRLAVGLIVGAGAFTLAADYLERNRYFRP